MNELYKAEDGFEEEYRELENYLRLESLIPIITATKQLRVTHMVQKSEHLQNLNNKLNPETILNLQITKSSTNYYQS